MHLAISNCCTFGFLIFVYKQAQHCSKSSFMVRCGGLLVRFSWVIMAAAVRLSSYNKSFFLGKIKGILRPIKWNRLAWKTASYLTQSWDCPSGMTNLIVAHFSKQTRHCSKFSYQRIVLFDLYRELVLEATNSHCWLMLLSNYPKSRKWAVTRKWFRTKTHKSPLIMGNNYPLAVPSFGQQRLHLNHAAEISAFSCARPF